MYISFKKIKEPIQYVGSRIDSVEYRMDEGEGGKVVEECIERTVCDCV